VVETEATAENMQPTLPVGYIFKKKKKKKPAVWVKCILDIIPIHP